MTRSLLLLVPSAGAAAALAGTVLPWSAAAVIGALLGAVAAAVIWSIQRSRVHRLAASVNAWLGQERHVPVVTPGSPAWQELAVALNALGASFDRRGRRLRRARALRTALVRSLPEPALLFDHDGHLIVANAAASDRFDIPDGEVLTAAQAVGSHRLAVVVTEARDAGRAVRTEVHLEDRELTALAVPVGDESLLLVSDRSERRRVDALRRDFVANASHELKTPVSGIQALAEALQVTIDRDPVRARSLARRLGDEADRLGKLVHHLLDLRRLEHDGPADRAPVDLVPLVRHEVDRVRSSADERDLSVKLHLPARAVVVGAEDDLRLIVANLLDNAVSYNRPGGTIDVALRRAHGAWEFEVADTGIGIARHDLDRIFERFYRVDVARSRATRGTGLGLSIVRHATERQGGRITVDSILGEGSTFRVLLPIEPADGTRTSSRPPAG